MEVPAIHRVYRRIIANRTPLIGEWSLEYSLIYVTSTSLPYTLYPLLDRSDYIINYDPHQAIVAPHFESTWILLYSLLHSYYNLK